MATECLNSIIVGEIPELTSRLDMGTWSAFALAVLATVYVIFRARTRKAKDPLERRPMTAGLAQQRAVERQMSSLLVELSEMAKTISSSLDVRAAKLEALLDEADSESHGFNPPKRTPPQAIHKLRTTCHLAQFLVAKPTRSHHRRLISAISRFMRWRIRVATCMKLPRHCNDPAVRSN